jgi:hypothetical protein
MTRFVVGLLLLVAACSRGPEAARAPAPAQAWLLEVESAHAAADAAATPEAARSALESARDKPIPAAINPEDRRRVLQDLQFHLAAAALRARDAERAAREAERGLAIAGSRDEFTANLWIAKARAETARGHTHEAASAYQAALDIHGQLLDRALQGGP